MRVRDPVEVFLLCLLHRWQETAPPDRHSGLLGDTLTENCQVTRLVFALQKIASGRVDETFTKLERLTVKRDGSSYISRNERSMESPHPLGTVWYLEGCTSLEQKTIIVRQLRQLSLSPAFVAAVEDFVAGDPIDHYFPTIEEQEEILKRCEREASIECI